jgi:hypothetical protein
MDLRHSTSCNMDLRHRSSCNMNLRHSRLDIKYPGIDMKINKQSLAYVIFPMGKKNPKGKRPRRGSMANRRWRRGRGKEYRDGRKGRSMQGRKGRNMRHGI